jgi:hypothetical protein
MEVKIRGFIHHKAKESYNDCNDRYKVNFKTNKFAISDGVSSSFLSGSWAELLVNEFTEQAGCIDINQPFSLHTIQHLWAEEVEKLASKDGQKWFVKKFQKECRSAAATFAGLHFYYKDKIPYWDAIALGDTFLFYLPSTTTHSGENKNEPFKYESLPPKDGFLFNDFPKYIDSINKVPQGIYNSSLKNPLSPGIFLLMTDALAEWFIRDDGKALKQINKWTSQDSFVKKITRLRAQKKISNDDYSLLIVELADDSKDEINYIETNITDLSQITELKKQKTQKKSNTKQATTSLSIDDIIKKMKF